MMAGGGSGFPSGAATGSCGPLGGAVHLSG